MSTNPIKESLLDNLMYELVPLLFGTSGRRGLVINLTQLEIAINVTAELGYLSSLPHEDGGISLGDNFYIGYDLRPSSTALIEEFGGRGALFQTVCWAVKQAGFIPINLGPLPTPAVMLYATKHNCASIMVTGSHIPFDRNGYKLNTSKGELLKEDEQPITERVAVVRERFNSMPFNDSPFTSEGMLKVQPDVIGQILSDAINEYEQRYKEFFGPSALSGLRLLVYQHAAVGRDFLVKLLKELGADVVAAGRSDIFVPIDTEAIDANQITTIQKLVDDNGSSFDAVVSTDGDSDRPLLLGVTNGKVTFFSGDLLGIITAQSLQPDSVVVPISCNDAIDQTNLKPFLSTKTKIGSPYVIKGMQEAIAEGKSRVCGWEANGGFLVGSDLTSILGTLTRLATRDAMLPIISVLCAAKSKALSLTQLFQELPHRYGRASLLRNFPRATSQKIVSLLKSGDNPPTFISFTEINTVPQQLFGVELTAHEDPLLSLKRLVETYFSAELGFASVDWIDYTDGVRCGFQNGDVAHVRPSGNADELRIYSVAGTPERANEIVTLGVKEPDGILRKLQAYATEVTTLQAWSENEKPFPILAAIKKYDWGGKEFIPSILGIQADGSHFAELWYGDHNAAPSPVTICDLTMPFNRALDIICPDVLGHALCEVFNSEFPYLLKILDAQSMLSIQVHPNKEQAKEGFDRENEMGIALSSASRNYHDSNHKPEVHVALTQMWMLHGFKTVDEIALEFTRLPELTELSPEFQFEAQTSNTHEEVLKTLYSRTMTLDQQAVDMVAVKLVNHLKSLPTPSKANPDYWVLKAIENMQEGHFDRGIFSLYLLNLVLLSPGQSTFQPCGTLHAYLEGTTVELMACSDNVIRSGLTNKHVDIPELLKTVTFKSRKPLVDSGELITPFERTYKTPATEFELSRIRIKQGNNYERIQLRGPEILVVTEGSVKLVTCGDTFELSRGHAIVVPDNIYYTLATEESGTVFRAKVPW